MTFEELDRYLREPKPQEPRSFVEADMSEANLLLRQSKRVLVHTEEVLANHQGVSRSLRVIPHARYSPVSTHSHDFYELMYVCHGSIRHHFGGQDVALQETDAILLPPGTAHSIDAAGAEDLAVSIILPRAYFAPDVLERMTRLSRLSAFFRGRRSGESETEYLLWRGNGDSRVRTCANSFLCEAFDPDRYSGAAIDAALLLFLTALERLCPEDAAPQRRNIETDFDRIIEYITQHFATVSLRELSVRFGYSENYLSRIIKDKLEMPFKDFQHQLCMRQSAFLLETTDYSIRQVAQEAGLSNLSFFYRLFARFYGMSPAEYRKTCRGDTPEKL